MSGIHPVSAALLLICAVGLSCLGGVLLVRLVQRWRYERRKEAVLPEDPVIDLTYFQEATAAFREAARRSEREGRAVAGDRVGSSWNAPGHRPSSHPGPS